MGLDDMASARGHRMQGTEHDIAFFLALGCVIAFRPFLVLLDGMASARGHRMRGTEHDIAFFLALGCAIALHCIALHCIVL